MLMIGDAPGDLKAARACELMFFPVNPGHEEDAWQRLHDEALDRFFTGTYGGRIRTALGSPSLRNYYLRRRRGKGSLPVALG